MDDLFNRLTDDPAWVCQAKMNGKRAIWDGTQLWSRSGNQITPYQAAGVLRDLAGLNVCLDGELITRKSTGEEVFWTFDLPDHRGPLRERWPALQNLLRDFDRSSCIELCPSSVSWGDVERHGWEGVVFKKLSSKYEKSSSEGKTTPSWVKYRAEWL